MDDIKIAVAMPSYNDMNPLVSHALSRACIFAERKGFSIQAIGGTQNQILTTARNAIVNDLLAGDATHLVFVDADVVIPVHAIAALVEADKDIVTGIYFQKEAPYLPLIMVKGSLPKHGKKKGLHSFIVEWPKDKIFPIDNGGLGCCLIKKEVFERIKAPWFEWKEGESGEDINFFMKAKAEHIDMFCHPQVLCGHITTKIVSYDDFEAQGLVASSQVEVSAGVYAEVVKDGVNVCRQYQKNC